MEKKFAQGIYYNDAPNNAPEWVRGSISIKKDEFQTWLKEIPSNDKGYIKLDILMSKKGEPYLALNTWKKEERTEPKIPPYTPPAESTERNPFN